MFDYFDLWFEATDVVRIGRRLSGMSLTRVKPNRYNICVSIEAIKITLADASKMAIIISSRSLHTIQAHSFLIPSCSPFMPRALGLRACLVLPKPSMSWRRMMKTSPFDDSRPSRTSTLTSSYGCNLLLDSLLPFLVVCTFICMMSVAFGLCMCVR